MCDNIFCYMYMICFSHSRLVHYIPGHQRARAAVTSKYCLPVLIVYIHLTYNLSKMLIKTYANIFLS